MPLRSMTGFGRGTGVADDCHATVELASVNRKQAEVSLSAPRELTALEPRIKQLILQEISRGRVQINLSITRTGKSQNALRLDDAMALALDAEFQRISLLLGRDLQAQAGDFLNVPGLLQGAEPTVDAEAIWPAVECALKIAIEQFRQSRTTEGAALAGDMTTRLDLLAAELTTVIATAPGRAAKQSELLQKRLIELGCPIDANDERLLKELALFADRCDISEEITRLQSHFAAFRNYLVSDDAPGRALDFLCQEIHREWNTIGSKAQDSGIAQAVVRAKTELEKIREQVQNLE